MTDFKEMLENKKKENIEGIVPILFDIEVTDPLHSAMQNMAWQIWKEKLEQIKLTNIKEVEIEKIMSIKKELENIASVYA